LAQIESELQKVARELTDIENEIASLQEEKRRLQLLIEKVPLSSLSHNLILTNHTHIKHKRFFV
jgi:regulator of replication initiation timing